MATLNLGAIRFNWKGAWNNSDNYVVNDVVSASGNSYICIQAHSNQAVGNATAYWNIMSTAGTNGTNGTDVGTTITTQGDILYRDGSGLQRLGAGTNGQALITGGSGANPSWGTISSGTYSVHAFAEYNYGTNVSHSGSSNYIDIAGGNTVNFTPTSTNDYIMFSHYCDTYQSAVNTGVDVYLMMKASSSSIGSGDTKLNYSGQHALYINEHSFHAPIMKTFILSCSSLSAGTTYYVEQAGGCHQNNNVVFNHLNNSGDNTYGKIRHYVNLTHFKKN